MEEIKTLTDKILETQPLNSGSKNQTSSFYDEAISLEARKGENLEKYGIYSKYANTTFETVQETEAQKDNWEQARAYGDNIRENVREGVGLLLKGEVGTGKTTLAICIMRRAIENQIPAYFLPMASLVDTLFMLRDNNERWKFQKKVRETTVLILDDLGAESRQEFIASAIDSIITERNNRGLPTFITTNLTNEELVAKYSKRTLDRIKEQCVVLNFVGGSLRKYAKIIRRS